MRKIETAAVTGATGAVGTALCQVLSHNGVRVFAFLRPGSPRNRHLRNTCGVETIECDLLGLVNATRDLFADAFFHFGWMGTTGTERNNMGIQVRNIQYALDAVYAAKAMGCEVFIGAGSQAEYGRHDAPLTPCTPCFPENGYGMAKLCAGQMSRAECAKLGMDHVWPRILSVYGPWDGEKAMIPQVIRKLLKGEKPALTRGEQLWDYLYADDAAEALYRMALHGVDGAVYPLGSGCARPLRTYIEALRDAIDPGLPLGFGEIPYGEKQVMRIEADLQALTEDTGWKPETDFETGIRKTIEWMKERT